MGQRFWLFKNTSGCSIAFQASIKDKSNADRMPGIPSGRPTLQIKRACNELEPTDTFPLKLYAEIVSNVILYRDTHIEIKLRNGQIL